MNDLLWAWTDDEKYPARQNNLGSFFLDEGFRTIGVSHALLAPQDRVADMCCITRWSRWQCCFLFSFQIPQDDLEIGAPLLPHESASGTQQIWSPGCQSGARS